MADSVVPGKEQNSLGSRSSDASRDKRYVALPEITVISLGCEFMDFFASCFTSRLDRC